MMNVLSGTAPEPKVEKVRACSGDGLRIDLVRVGWRLRKLLRAFVLRTFSPFWLRRKKRAGHTWPDRPSRRQASCLLMLLGGLRHSDAALICAGDGLQRERKP